jgi:hypothetical protein
MIRRCSNPLFAATIALMFALGLVSSAAQAHSFATRMQAVFPTVARSGIQITMKNAEDQPVTDAILELRVQFGALTRSINLRHSGNGEYVTEEQFVPGKYVFTVSDKTIPGEPLVKTFDGDLPRPAGQDVQFWDWPASPGAAGPNVGLLLTLLGAPVFLALAAVVVVLLVSRSKPKPQV